MILSLLNNGVYFVSTDPPMLRLSFSQAERKKRRRKAEEKFGELLSLIEFAHDCFSAPTTSQKRDKQDREMWFMVLVSNLNKLVLTLLVCWYRAQWHKKRLRLPRLLFIWRLWTPNGVEAAVNLYKSGLQKDCESNNEQGRIEPLQGIRRVLSNSSSEAENSLV